MEQEKIKSIIESVLLINGEPIKISRLAKIVGAHKAEIENAVMVLSGEYESQNRGFRILKSEDEIQLATNPENAQFVDQLVKGELQEALSPAALEVLSVVAYRGPVTRANIEAIRGVNSSFTLRNLLMRGLVNREENPHDARSYVYRVSFDFLKHLGIENVQKLPDFEALSQDERINQVSGEILADGNNQSVEKSE